MSLFRDFLSMISILKRTQIPCIGLVAYTGFDHEVGLHTVPTLIIVEVREAMVN